MVARFKSDRDEEYREFISKCADFRAEIAKETKARHFAYAEIEENDVDLKKLQSWLVKIRKLDFCRATLAAEAEQRLRDCEALLEKIRPARFRDARRKSLRVGRFMKPVLSTFERNRTGGRSMAFEKWKAKARKLKREVYALYLVSKDRRVPWYARVVAVAVVAYAFSPIDLIPTPSRCLAIWMT